MLGAAAIGPGKVTCQILTVVPLDGNLHALMLPQADPSEAWRLLPSRENCRFMRQWRATVAWTMTSCNWCSLKVSRWSNWLWNWRITPRDSAMRSCQLRKMRRSKTTKLPTEPPEITFENVLLSTSDRSTDRPLVCCDGCKDHRSGVGWAHAVFAFPNAGVGCPTWFRKVHRNILDEVPFSLPDVKMKVFVQMCDSLTCLIPQVNATWLPQMGPSLLVRLCTDLSTCS